MTVTTESRSNGKPKRQRRAWTPGDRDHLIYRWVKFDGMTQLHTAADFGISQATVSRIVDRYERWQAHAEEREGGRLDPAERRRAQRWLTYERNERILASALRIADRMEGVTESWKSVKTRPLSKWHKEGTEIRSEEQSVDRHGVAARFLRLAFRINMEQLKLVEQDAPPMPQGLGEEELAAEAQRDAAVAEDLAKADWRSAEQTGGVEAGSEDAPAAAEVPTVPQQGCSRPVTVESEVTVPGSEDLMHEVHNLHNSGDEKTSPTTYLACSYAADAPAEENADHACISPDRAPADGDRIKPLRAWADPRSLATSAS